MGYRLLVKSTDQPFWHGWSYHETFESLASEINDNNGNHPDMLRKMQACIITATDATDHDFFSKEDLDKLGAIFVL